MRVFRGTPPFGHGAVTVRTAASGPAPPLNPRTDALRRSDGEFAWGCRNGAAAQLSFALLAECCEFLGDAIDLHLRFCDEVISALDPREPWKLTDEEVREWISRALDSPDALEASGG